MLKSINLGNGLFKFKPHFLVKYCEVFAGMHACVCVYVYYACVWYVCTVCVCSCASVCVCVCVCVCTSCCTCMQRRKEDIGCLALSHFALFPETESLSKLVTRLLANSTQQSLVGASECWGCRCPWPHLAFYVAFEDKNEDPHACTAKQQSSPPY